MKEINYIKKSDREISGMYYVDSYKNMDSNSVINRWYMLFDPFHYPVKPVLDYLKYLYRSGVSEEKMSLTARSLCHYYNFIRVHKFAGDEEITHELLNSYIRYLSVVPKGLSKRITSKLKSKHDNTVKLWELKYLPVHPYINGGVQINIILKEWYMDFWSNVENKNNLTFFIDSRDYHVHEDEKDWRYSFQAINQFVNITLDYLKYLSESVEWSHKFKAIDPKVAKLERKYNSHSKNVYYTWDVQGRIKRETLLKPNSNERQRRRVLFESELIRFFQAEMLKTNSQRKLVFILMLLSGARISEILNILLKKITITMPKNAITKELKMKHAVIHWEDLFYTNGFEKNDIVITEDLEFKIKIVKRFAYEDKLRKNKTSVSRFPTLKDYFDLPTILNLNCDSIFVQPKDVVNIFRDAIILNKMEENPRNLIKRIMEYHSNSINKGIDIENNSYDIEIKDWIFRIRRLIEDSWLGQVIRKYLIERHLVQLRSNNKNPLHRDFLFINLKINKGKPMLPQTVREYWFKKICMDVEISRYGIPVNEIFNHSKKADLTIHSFRHTYISMRINSEALDGDFSRVNLANLKKDIGHVVSSNVAEVVYYFADLERKKTIYTKVFKSLSQNIEKIIIKDGNEIESG